MQQSLAHRRIHTYFACINIYFIRSDQLITALITILTRVTTCVLLDKQVPRAAPIEPDFLGFRCPSVFVVGYGMDLAHRYRELPFIGEVVEP
jgi:hypoxanthine-guanine phosphoribosyltransferase